MGAGSCAGNSRGARSSPGPGPHASKQPNQKGTMEQSGAQRFVTEDLTFVTVLLMDGIHHSDMINRNGGCRWVYEGAVVERVLDKLDMYNDDACDVEPREFTRKLGLVRQNMYQFLGYQPPKVRAGS